MPTTATRSSEESTTNLETAYSTKARAYGRELENVDAASGQRLPTVPNAWASGTNPLTQRPINPNPQYSNISRVRSAIPSRNSGLLREGHRVKVTLESGAEFEGIYSGATESAFTLRMVQQKKLPASADSNGVTKPTKEQPSMSFQKKDVVDIHVTGAGLPKGDGRIPNGFRTDTAISGNKASGERVLQPWIPDADIETDMSLESSTSGAGWDQFAANEKLFGLKTDYNENIYTTTIDRSHPDYQKRRAEADRKAREIEGTAATNSHVAEERIRDNLTVDKSGRDEEDKYSGVGKAPDFPSLGSDRSNKYTPPARRPPTGQATVSGAPVDPAIISSQLARPDRQKVDQSKAPQPLQAKIGLSTSPTTTDSSFVATSEAKITPLNTSASVSRTASPQSRPGAAPNATATVERDVASAFKTFATQQRRDVDKLRNTRARADKESKLSDLKKFSETFKLNSPVPDDLVPIIAKDPAKQREIQVKSKLNAEQAEQAKHAKLRPVNTSATASPASEKKTGPRPAVSPQGTTTPGASNRQVHNRVSAVPLQGPYNAQSFRADRSNQGPPSQRGAPVQGLGPRLRNIEQAKNGGMLPSHHQEARLPPTGPANGTDPIFSRRSSGATSALNGKLNPNSNEFRPNGAALSFSPNSNNRSTGSSPQSGLIPAANLLIPSPSGSLLRRRQLQGSTKVIARGKFDVIENLSKLQPPTGKDWSRNGGFRPAFDTPPTWKQIDPEKETDPSTQLTYAKLFEALTYSNVTGITTPQQNHVNPQVAHQHQLPFHLQQGAHNIGQRQSPRQPPMHLQNNHHNHGADDHRMVPSHSAQSFASPRLQQVNMAYPSPMGQPAQLVYNQNGMQFPMVQHAPQIPQYRTYSGGHQFVPQPGGHMGAPIMMQAPNGNGFMAAPGMVSPAPQMMYPVSGPHFVPQGPPPNIPGANGFPSPGRGAPIMMHQGSQQGHQPIYGMSPNMQYGQPIYGQQPPGPMQNVRGYPQGQQQFGTSPQLQQFGQPHRGGPSGNYNKNNQSQHGAHAPVQSGQAAAVAQPRLEGSEESK